VLVEKGAGALSGWKKYLLMKGDECGRKNLQSFWVVKEGDREKVGKVRHERD